MAITSYGYPDLIPPGQTWAIMQMGLGRQYVAPFEDDCRVSKVVGGTRQTRVSTGYLGGKGIIDNNGAPVTLAHDVVGSGTRYDAVVLRRWIDNTAVDPDVPFRSEFAIVKGTSARAIPALTQNPGTLDEQPIALAGFRAGQTEAFEIVDLRAIAEEPGVYTIYDDLALQTIDRPGAQAYNANTGVTYRRVYNAQLGREWQRLPKGPGSLLAVYNLGWHKMPPSGQAGLQNSVQVWGNAVQDIASTLIPDPGVPYRVAVSAAGFWGSELKQGDSRGTARWDLDVLVGGDGGIVTDTWIPDYSFSYESAKRFVTLPSGSVFTGSKVVSLRARKIGGGWPWGALAVHNRQGRIAIYEA